MRWVRLGMCELNRGDVVLPRWTTRAISEKKEKLCVVQLFRKKRMRRTRWFSLEIRRIWTMFQVFLLFLYVKMGGVLGKYQENIDLLQVCSARKERKSVFLPKWVIVACTDVRENRPLTCGNLISRKLCCTYIEIGIFRWEAINNVRERKAVMYRFPEDGLLVLLMGCRFRHKRNTSPRSTLREGRCKII